MVSETHLSSILSYLVPSQLVDESFGALCNATGLLFFRLFLIYFNSINI